MLSFQTPITPFAKYCNEATGRGATGTEAVETNNKRLHSCYSQTGNSAFGVNLKPKEGKIQKLRQS
jgi:hypothetical protein